MRVITLPVSEIERPVDAVNVTPVEPDVLLLMIEVVPVPAPTVRAPSFVMLPSTSVPVIVKFGYVPVTLLIPAPVSDTVTSGRVLVIVMFDVVPVSEMPVPAVCVTSVPVDELSVTGDDAPEKVRSVVAVAVAGAHVVPFHCITWLSVAPPWLICDKFNVPPNVESRIFPGTTSTVEPEPITAPVPPVTATFVLPAVKFPVVMSSVPPVNVSGLPIVTASIHPVSPNSNPLRSVVACNSSKIPSGSHCADAVNGRRNKR